MNIVDKVLEVFLICIESTTSDRKKCARNGTHMDPTDRTDNEPLESSRIQKLTESTDSNKCARPGTHIDPTDSFRTNSEPSESSRTQKSTESGTSDCNKYARILTHMDSNPSFRTIGIF